MELLRQFRSLTARAASSLGSEPLRHSRWARRARIALYIFATVLLAWELYITRPDDPFLLTLARILTVATLYLLGRWPQIAAGVSLVPLVVEYTLGLQPHSLVVLVPLTIAAVLIASRSRPLGYTYVLAAIAILASIESTGFPLVDLVSWVAFFFIPCVVGEVVRSMLTSIERLRVTAEHQLRRQRRELARELHDTSIHDLTAMIMALERAKLAGIANPRAAEEIDHAIATGRQSVVSMRGVLKFLRNDETRNDGIVPPSETIAPTLPTVRQVLDTAKAALAREGLGLQVHVEDQIDLPMPFSVRTALVRVIQEATANMAKYGKPGTTGTVMMERTDTDTRALFVNDVADDANEDAAKSSKLGLVGVRERVEAVGGTASVRHHDGRWMMQVSIPTIGSVSEGQVERARQH